jgi:hypothetical protein
MRVWGSYSSHIAAFMYLTTHALSLLHHCSKKTKTGAAVKSFMFCFSSILSKIGHHISQARFLITIEYLSSPKQSSAPAPSFNNSFFFAAVRVLPRIEQAG